MIYIFESIHVAKAMNISICSPRYVHVQSSKAYTGTWSSLVTEGQKSQLSRNFGDCLGSTAVLFWHRNRNKCSMQQCWSLQRCCWTLWLISQGLSRFIASLEPLLIAALMMSWTTVFSATWISLPKPTTYIGITFTYLPQFYLLTYLLTLPLLAIALQCSQSWNGRQALHVWPQPDGTEKAPQDVWAAQWFLGVAAQSPVGFGHSMVAIILKVQVTNWPKLTKPAIDDLYMIRRY